MYTKTQKNQKFGELTIVEVTTDGAVLQVGAQDTISGIAKAEAIIIVDGMEQIIGSTENKRWRNNSK